MSLMHASQHCMTKSCLMPSALQACDSGSIVSLEVPTCETTLRCVMVADTQSNPTNKEERDAAIEAMGDAAIEASLSRTVQKYTLCQPIVSAGAGSESTGTA